MGTTTAVLGAITIILLIVAYFRDPDLPFAVPPIAGTLAEVLARWY